MRYLDVSRLLRWGGSYTGMERFAYEITGALLAQDDDVRLCFFEPGVGFCEIGDRYATDGGRLTSPLAGPAPTGGGTLARGQRLAGRAVGKAQRYVRPPDHQHLTAGPADALLIYDGLWDKPAYTDAIAALSARGVLIGHVLHDMVPLVMPHLVLDYVTEVFRAYFDRVTPLVDVLFSISRNTQADFADLFGHLLKPDVAQVVTRHGENFGHAPPTRPALPLQEGGFLLVVGTVEIRKNHQLLYQAYRLADERRIELPPLVIVGRDGWMADATVKAMRNDPRVRDRFVFAGPVDDAELSWLYESCLFTVFPALYEGWGLPLAESVARGKLCLSSSTSSMPEIAGELIDYYSPYDPAACLEAIARYLDPETLAAKQRALVAGYRTTTWSETADTISRGLNRQGT